MGEQAHCQDLPTTNDPLGGSIYCDSIVDTIRRVDTLRSVGIFGESGVGKTHLMQMIEKAVRASRDGSPPLKTIWLSASTFNKERDSFGALLLSFLEHLRASITISATHDRNDVLKKEEQLNTQLDNLQETLFEMLRVDDLGSLEINLSLANNNFIKLSSPFFSQFPGLLEDLINQSSGSGDGNGSPEESEFAIQDLLSGYKRRRTRDCVSRIQLLNRFRWQFNEFSKLVSPNDQRIAVFFDDFDCCYPEKIVEMLEAIRLLNESARFVNIIAIDPGIIGAVVRQRLYGNNQPNNNTDTPAATTSSYMEKIIQLPVYLTPLDAQTVRKLVREELSADFHQSVVNVLVAGAAGNPRKIKRSTNIFRLLYSFAQKRKLIRCGEVQPDLLAKLAVIQVNGPEAFYTDIIHHPCLLAELEDYIEKPPHSEVVDRSFDRIRVAQERASAVESLENSSTAQAAKPNVPRSLIIRYAEIEELRIILMLPKTNRFRDHNVVSHLYLSAPGVEESAPSQDPDEPPNDHDISTQPAARKEVNEEEKQFNELRNIQTSVAEKPESEKPEKLEAVNEDIAAVEFSVNNQVWASLMSDDLAGIYSEVKRLNESDKKGYCDRLLSIIRQHENDLLKRVMAGNALGILGDPRIQELEMITIPCGEFAMGTDDGDDTSPKHDVYLQAFEISKYPLTNTQYKAFLDDNPQHKAPDEWKERSYPPGTANHPVVNISHNDALAYTHWLSKNTGNVYRLPTEAEWEKAARGTDQREYPWGNEFDPYNCNTREKRKLIQDARKIATTPVGIYSRGISPYGIMDMAGNVWEWCADWYAAEYYNVASKNNPKGPDRGEVCVVRGGSWRSDYDHARCVYRHWDGPDYWFDHVGMRLCREQ